MNKLTEQLKCENISFIFLQIIEINLCNNIFNGFYGLWIIFFLVSGCLYGLIVVACLLYEYFNEYWNIVLINENVNENVCVNENESKSEVNVNRSNEVEVEVDNIENNEL